MKRKNFRSKLALIAAAALTMSLGMGFSASAEDGELPITSEYFPDAAFCRYVSENCDKDGSGTLSDDEISRTTSISVANMGISSLNGIANADMNKDGKITNADIILLGRLYMSQKK